MHETWRKSECGARLATGTLVVTIDADSTMTPGTLIAIDQAIASGTTVGGGTIIRPDRMSAGIFRDARDVPNSAVELSHFGLAVLVPPGRLRSDRRLQRRAGQRRGPGLRQAFEGYGRKIGRPFFNRCAAGNRYLLQEIGHVRRLARGDKSLTRMAHSEGQKSAYRGRIFYDVER